MRKDTCIHYSANVFRRGECDKNINVRNLVGGDDKGWLGRTPCFTKHKSDIVCKHFAEPTKQDLEDAEKEWDELIKRMNEAEANDEMLDDCELFSEISMIDLDGKKFKRMRHVIVD